MTASEHTELLPAVEKIEMVDWSSGFAEPADPVWRIVLNGYCADFPTETAAQNFAGAIAAWNGRPEPEMDLWPDDPAPIADKAVDHVFKDLARVLGLETWYPQDGSESWEGDVFATMMRILTDAGVIDPETGTRWPVALPDGAEPVPVAWRWRHSGGPWRFLDNGELPDDRDAYITSQPGYEAAPVFASPTGMGVTEEMVDEAAFGIWYLRVKGDRKVARDRWDFVKHDASCDAVKEQARAALTAALGMEGSPS